jgi:hypothetical protein
MEAVGALFEIVGGSNINTGGLRAAFSCPRQHSILRKWRAGPFRRLTQIIDLLAWIAVADHYAIERKSNAAANRRDCDRSPHERRPVA